MNIMQTSNALALAQAFDNRTVGEANVRAWHAILSELDADDVMEAIRRHYLAESAWIMPAHIVRLVGEIRREREKAARKWAPGQYGVPKDDPLPEIEHGARLTADDVSPEVLDLLMQLRATLPDVGREVLFPRQVAWEREQRAYRAADGGEPNPHYRPRPADPDPAEVVWAARIADCRTNGPHDSGLHIIGCPEWRGTPEDAPLGRCAFCGAAYVGDDALNPEHPGGPCR